jgi:Caspase domain
MTKDSNIYALLIGINEYKDQDIGPLDGCVNDINRFEQYLLSALKVPPTQISKLLNKQATKKGIVAAFETRFAQATKNDVCIFYFAGHGVRQYANPVFRAESNNDSLECLVCYDANFDGENMLADKEQRWLIGQLADKSDNCHILTIFDCCHSGDNTRAVGKSDTKERMMRERGEEWTAPQRLWNEFIFGEQITEQMIADNAAANNNLDAIFPQGRHIQLAACGSNETAKEVFGSDCGYFSKYLMNLLESSNGNMTYFDMRSLIYRQLSTLPPEKQQTPQFYAVGSSIFQPFLGGAAQTEITATVNFNTKEDRWEMNMGAIYGVYKGATVFVTLPHKNNEVEAAKVEEVFHDSSVLTFDIETVAAEQAKPDAEKRVRRTDMNYKAATGKFMQKEVKIACVSDDLAPKWASFCQKGAALLENAFVKIVGKSSEADYVLNYRQNTEGSQIFFAEPNYPNRPLVKLLNAADLDAAFGEIIEQLTAVSRWAFVKNQTSEPDADSLLDNLSFDFTRDGKTTNLQTSNAPMPCVITRYKYFEDEDLNYEDVLMTIKITNNHPTHTLYVAGIWLTEIFEIDTTIIKQKSLGTPLEPTKSAFVIDTTFNLVFGNNILMDKWDKFLNYIRIYVSDKPFDLTQLKQMALERPYQDAPRGEEERTRAGGRMPSSEPQKPQWAVKEIILELDTSQLKK